MKIKECAGHVQKRIVMRLRKCKRRINDSAVKENSPGNVLTNSVLWKAVRDSCDSVEKMINAS